jgi:hypothetical protein
VRSSHDPLVLPQAPHLQILHLHLHPPHEVSAMSAISMDPGNQPFGMHMYTWSHRQTLSHM